MPERDGHDARDTAAFAALSPDSMALRVTRRCPPREPGLAEVKVSGECGDVAVILAVLRAGADGGRYEIAAVRGPYRNQPEPGLRMYVTVRCRAGDAPAGDTGGPGGDAAAGGPLSGRRRMRARRAAGR